MSEGEFDKVPGPESPEESSELVPGVPDDEIEGLVREVLKKFGYSEKELTPETIADEIDRIRKSGGRFGQKLIELAQSAGIYKGAERIRRAVDDMDRTRRTVRPAERTEAGEPAFDKEEVPDIDAMIREMAVMQGVKPQDVDDEYLKQTLDDYREMAMARQMTLLDVVKHDFEEQRKTIEMWEAAIARKKALVSAEQIAPAAEAAPAPAPLDDVAGEPAEEESAPLAESESEETDESLRTRKPMKRKDFNELVEGMTPPPRDQVEALYRQALGDRYVPGEYDNDIEADTRALLEGVRIRRFRKPEEGLAYLGRTIHAAHSPENMSGGFDESDIEEFPWDYEDEEEAEVVGGGEEPPRPSAAPAAPLPPEGRGGIDPEEKRRRALAEDILRKRLPEGGELKIDRDFIGNMRRLVEEMEGEAKREGVSFDEVAARRLAETRPSDALPAAAEAPQESALEPAMTTDMQERLVATDDMTDEELFEIVQAIDEMGPKRISGRGRDRAKVLMISYKNQARRRGVSLSQVLNEELSARTGMAEAEGGETTEATAAPERRARPMPGMPERQPYTRAELFRAMDEIDRVNPQRDPGGIRLRLRDLAKKLKKEAEDRNIPLSQVIDEYLAKKPAEFDEVETPAPEPEPESETRDEGDSGEEAAPVPSEVAAEAEPEPAPSDDAAVEAVIGEDEPDFEEESGPEAKPRKRGIYAFPSEKAPVTGELSDAEAAPLVRQALQFVDGPSSDQAVAERIRAIRKLARDNNKTLGDAVIELFASYGYSSPEVDALKQRLETERAEEKERRARYRSEAANTPKETRHQAFDGLRTEAREEVDVLRNFVTDVLEVDPAQYSGTIWYMVRTKPATGTSPGVVKKCGTWSEVLEARGKLTPAELAAVDKDPRAIEPKLDTRLLDLAKGDPENSEAYDRLKADLKAERFPDFAARQAEGWQRAIDSNRENWRALSMGPEDGEHWKAKMSADPVFRWLADHGVQPGSVGMNDILYRTIVDLDPRDPNGTAVIRTLNSYTDYGRARASMSSERREAADGLRLKKEIPGKEPERKHKLMIDLAPALAARFEQGGDLHEFKGDFERFIDDYVRNELVPDAYAARVVAEERMKAEAAAEEERLRREANARFEKPIDELRSARMSALSGKNAVNADIRREMEKPEGERDPDLLRKLENEWLRLQGDIYRYEDAIIAKAGDAEYARLDAAYGQARADYYAESEKPDGERDDAKVVRLRQRYYQAEDERNERRLSVIEGTAVPSPEPHAAAPSPEPAPAPAAAPEVLPESEMTREFESRFGLSREDLGRIEGFKDLTDGQKKLVFANLSELALLRVQEEARDQFKNDTAGSGESLIKKWGGRWQEFKEESSASALRDKGIFHLLGIAKDAVKGGASDLAGSAADLRSVVWKRMTKLYQIRSLEKEKLDTVLKGGAAVHGDVLAQLVRGTAELGLDAHEHGGELYVDFVAAKDLCDVTDMSAAGERKRKLVAKFNEAAREMANRPIEKANKSASIFSKAGHMTDNWEYQSLRKDVLQLRLERNGYDELDAAKYMADLGARMQASEYFNANPKVEKDLRAIKDKKVASLVLRDIAAERGAQLVMGGFARSVSFLALGPLSLPFVGLALGGIRGRQRAFQALREREAEHRRGVKVVREDVSGYRARAEALEADLEAARREYAIAGNKETVKDAKAKVDLLERRLRKLNRTINDKVHGERNFVRAVGFTNQQGRFRGGLTEKIKDLIEEVNNPRDAAHKERALRELDARLTYTSGKLREGLVQFGESGRPDEIATRVSQKLELVKLVAEGEMLAAANHDILGRRAPELVRIDETESQIADLKRRLPGASGPDEEQAINGEIDRLQKRIHRLQNSNLTVRLKGYLDLQQKEHASAKQRSGFAGGAGGMAGAGIALVVGHGIRAGLEHTYEAIFGAPGNHAGIGAGRRTGVVYAAQKAAAPAGKAAERAADEAAPAPRAAPQEAVQHDKPKPFDDPKARPAERTVQKPVERPSEPQAERQRAAGNEAGSAPRSAEQAARPEAAPVSAAKPKMPDDLRESIYRHFESDEARRKMIEQFESGKATEKQLRAVMDALDGHAGQGAAARGAEAASADEVAPKGAESVDRAEAARKAVQRRIAEDEARERAAAERPGGARGSTVTVRSRPDAAPDIRNAPPVESGRAPSGVEEVPPRAERGAPVEEGREGRAPTVESPVAREAKAAEANYDTKHMREVVRTNWASDKGTLIRQLDALDSIAQDGVSDREIPKLINPLGAISRNFENQPLYLQEATLAHLRGIREEINGKSFTIRGRMHYGEELGYIQRQIAQMEQVTALTRQSFHESLAQFGYKDLSILERHRFTPASLMEMYEASKRKGEPQQPLVRWLVEDLDFKKLAKETPDVQVTEDLVKSRFVLGYRPGRGGFLRPSISWGRRRY